MPNGAFFLQEMNKTESKVQLPPVKFDVLVEQIHKRVQALRGDLTLQSKDKFGTQLPTRVLAEIFSFVGFPDVCRVAACCSSWILPDFLEDRVFQRLYTAVWEKDT